MKIVITGSSGVVGTYLMIALNDLGHEVLGIDSYTKPSLLHHGLKELKLDLLTDIDIIQQHVALFKPNVIIANAARVGGIRYFHTYPYTILADNIAIMKNTLRLALMNHTAVIYMSSSMVYEQAVDFPVPELATKVIAPPISAYGLSKLVGERMCEAAYKEHWLNYIILRPFNLTAPGEVYDRGVSHVVLDVLHQVRHPGPDNTIKIYGDGSQVRCFTSVLDLCTVVGKMLNNINAYVDEAYNVANPTTYNIASLVHVLWTKYRGSEPYKIIHEPSFKHDVEFRWPNISKLADHMGFRPSIPLENMARDIYGFLVMQEGHKDADSSCVWRPRLQWKDDYCDKIVAYDGYTILQEHDGAKATERTAVWQPHTEIHTTIHVPVLEADGDKRDL